VATLINALLFQATWFGCVLGGSEQPVWGLAGLGAMLLFASRRSHIRMDLTLLIFLVPVGWLLESLWIDQGILVYEPNRPPLWIPMLWAAVALTVNHSLERFKQYPMMGAALAAVAAPLCYLSGSQLGAVTTPVPLSLIWISCSWFVVFGGTFWIMKTRFGKPGSVSYG
jgi:hypothetical protein